MGLVMTEKDRENINSNMVTEFRKSEHICNQFFTIHLYQCYLVTTLRSQEHCGIHQMFRCHVESTQTTKTFGGIKKKPSTWNLGGFLILRLFTPSVLEHLDMSVAFC